MLQWQRAAEARAGTDPDESTTMDCDIAIYQTVYADADSDGPGSDRGRAQKPPPGHDGAPGPSVHPTAGQHSRASLIARTIGESAERRSPNHTIPTRVHKARQHATTHTTVDDDTRATMHHLTLHPLAWHKNQSTGLREAGEANAQAVSYRHCRTPARRSSHSDDSRSLASKSIVLGRCNLDKLLGLLALEGNLVDHAEERVGSLDPFALER